MLVYDFEGRFIRAAPVKSNVGNGKEMSGSGSVGDIGIPRKTVEAVTHWKLLGTSVRSSISSMSSHVC